MFMRSRRSVLRASCAVTALLSVTILPAALLPASSDAQAQTATPLPPVTVEKPIQPKAKAKAKVKTPATASQPTTDAGAAASNEGAARDAEKQMSLARPLTTTTISREDVAAIAPKTSDTATLLADVPGVSVYTGGGVSGLPSVHGLNDERVITVINGMPIFSACGNHMNPVLSHVDPAAVQSVDVIASIAPVSAGGDGLGSVIAVEAGTPQFANAGEGVVTHGSITAFARSGSNAIGGSVTGSAATSNVAISYTGSWTHADNYVDGKGNEVGSTLYEAQNHLLTLAARSSTDLVIINAGAQKIPYQGFVNQWMDMTDNEAWFGNVRYEKKFDWGKLYLQAYYQHTDHEMEFLSDKKTGRETKNIMPDMPMLTEGENMGYKIKAEIPVSATNTLRVGNELQRNTLSDWWPAVGTVASAMCCDTFLNINDGERTRIGTFAELETKWSKEWTTLVGVRNDIVMMNTGEVQGYNNIAGWYNGKMGMGARCQDASDPHCTQDWQRLYYLRDANAFNSADREKTDINFDVTASARYEQNSESTYEFGYARKTRSPSLYERYAWSTNGMAMSMIGWYGDGAPYVGNLDLKPEVANTVSVTADWHDKARKDWQIKVSPFYTYTEDYIGAKAFAINGMGPYYKLKFVNENAELYGVDVSLTKKLWEDYDFGRFTLASKLNYTYGENADTGNPLYHMMPLNAKFSLEHKIGRWTNAVELEVVAEKDRVDPVRLEPETSAYALVNVRTSYEWQNLRVDLGVTNVFDEYYQLPLGGVDLGYFPASNDAVSGEGRSFYASVTAKF